MRITAMSKDRWIGFAAGLALGLTTAAVSLGIRPLPRAEAQAARAEPRYRIETWATPGLVTTSAGVAREPIAGAYILDTVGGEVWYIRDQSRPSSLGKVGEARP